MSSREIQDYILDKNFVNIRKGGRFNQSIILKYEDDTEWVFLNNNQKDRFCGFLYLEHVFKRLNSESTLKKLSSKELNLNKIAAAENKMAIYDGKIIYLSRYCGEKKPEFFEHMDMFQTLQKKIGFIDIMGCANLREKDDKLYVFDTEKSSFSSSVHQKIDLFVNLHDAIRSSLEEKLSWNEIFHGFNELWILQNVSLNS